MTRDQYLGLLEGLKSTIDENLFHPQSDRMQGNVRSVLQAVADRYPSLSRSKCHLVQHF